jgi:hypothetical protein
LRASGIPVLRSVSGDADGAAREARQAGASWLLVGGELRAVAAPVDPAEERRLRALLEGSGG